MVFLCIVYWYNASSIKLCRRNNCAWCRNIYTGCMRCIRVCSWRTCLDLNEIIAIDTIYHCNYNVCLSMTYAWWLKAVHWIRIIASVWSRSQTWISCRLVRVRVITLIMLCEWCYSRCFRGFKWQQRRHPIKCRTMLIVLILLLLLQRA